MACKYNIKVVEHNDFTLLFPLKKRTYVASLPIDEDIVIMDLENVKVTIGGVEFASTLDERGVMVAVAYDTLERGTYNIIITAKYHGAQIRAAYFESLTIVDWSMQSDAEQYLPGSPIVMPAAFVIGGPLTDAELEALKEEYREKNAQLDQAIADAEEAKREWEEKAADLEGVAKEETLTQGVQDIRDDISHIDIDTTTLAKETSVKDGNDTAISVGKEIRSEVGTGSDTAAETGTLFAIVKWVKDKVKDIYNAITDSTNGLSAIKTSAASANTNAADAKTAAQAVQTLVGTPASGQPTDLFAAIAAGGSSIPVEVVDDSVSSKALDPNKLYIFANRTADLTITLNAGEQGVANEYHFFLSVGSILPTITFPNSIVWNGYAPIIYREKNYEFDILENVGLFVMY